MFNWKFWKKKPLPEINFDFVKDWDQKPKYSYIIFISDELKKQAGKRHEPLLFSCIKSLEHHSNMIHQKKAIIEIKQLNDNIQYKQRSLIIDDYVFFLKNPDSILFDNIFIYSSLFNKTNTLQLRDGPLKYLYDEFNYKEYEKIVGKEIAGKIFFKTENKLFNRLNVGDKFVYNEQIYEKVTLVLQGCCSPQFNCININDGENAIYLNNNVGVAKILC